MERTMGEREKRGRERVLRDFSFFAPEPCIHAARGLAFSAVPFPAHCIKLQRIDTRDGEQWKARRHVKRDRPREFISLNEHGVLTKARDPVLCAQA